MARVDRWVADRTCDPPLKQLTVFQGPGGEVFIQGEGMHTREAIGEAAILLHRACQILQVQAGIKIGMVTQP